MQIPPNPLNSFKPNTPLGGVWFAGIFLQDLESVKDLDLAGFGFDRIWILPPVWFAGFQIQGICKILFGLIICQMICDRK